MLASAEGDPTKEKGQQIRGWLPTLRSRPVLLGAFALVVGTHLLLTWRAISPFDGAFADGPFQLHNALRRIEAGQLPGRDFPAFHGLGIPLVHYPIYRLLGSGVLLAEVSRHLVSRLATSVGYLLLSWMLTRRLWPGVFWLVVRVCVDQLFALAHISSLGDLDGPGNSLTALRALVPLLFIGFVYRSPIGWRGALWLGAVLAIAWFLGVEQGLALAAGMLVTGLAAQVISSFKALTMERPPLLRAFFIGIAVTFGLILLLCGNRWPDVLRFYFVTLPKDQTWYFGAPPNLFFGDGARITLLIAVVVVLVGLGFAAVWCWALRQTFLAIDSDRNRMLIATAVGAGFCCFALVSNLGIVSPSYLFMPAKIAVILATAWLVREARHSPRLVQMGEGLNRSLALRAIAACTLAAWVVWLGISVSHCERPGMSDRITSVTKGFGERVRSELPQLKTGDLWSTYAGILEDELNVFHPDVDFIIHALGNERDSYVTHFAELRPRFVQTMRRDVFKYDEWLEDSTWGFYERVITNYEIVATSEYSYLWRRKDEPWIEPPRNRADQTLTIAEGQESAKIAACPGASNLAVVKLSYETVNPLKRLPILGNQARFLVSVTGARSRYPVSLPPDKSNWEFPVFINPGESFDLTFRVRGLTVGSRLRVSQVSVRCLTLNKPNNAFLTSTIETHQNQQ